MGQYSTLKVNQPEKEKQEKQENKSNSNKRWFDLMGSQGRKLCRNIICDFPEKTEAARPNPAKMRPAIWVWMSISCFHHQIITSGLSFYQTNNKEYLVLSPFLCDQETRREGSRPKEPGNGRRKMGTNITAGMVAGKSRWWGNDMKILEKAQRSGKSKNLFKQ